MRGMSLETIHLHRPRTILNVTLRELAQGLFGAGVDLIPNAHEWVTDASIQTAYDSGQTDTRHGSNPPHTHRAIRTATFVRMIDDVVTILDDGRPFHKFYAECYFRGTAIRFKIIDGLTRERAMQFRHQMNTKVEIHTFGEEQRVLRDAFSSCQILTASAYDPAQAVARMETV
jgi:hypothetical protein